MNALRTDERGPRDIGRCWDIADKNIAKFKAALDSGNGHPLVCREKIDQWLEYRHSHGSEDRARL